MDRNLLMVCQDGAHTLFELVEMGTAFDSAELVKELRLPSVMIDITLPARQLAAMPARRTEAERVRLIVVNVHAGNDIETAGLVAQWAN